MQALIQTVFPCYAEADMEIAAGLATFLERGADVRVFLEEGCLVPGQNLADKAREARTADTVLVLFSRQSMPPRWPRAQWEDALVKEPAAEGVRIAFLRLDDCVPPRVLEPRFEVAELSLAGLRAVKRWVRRAPRSLDASPAPRLPGCELDLELLGIALADHPGSDVAPNLELALDFADAFRADFDAVLRLECAGRSLAALAGDLAAQLDLRLEGPLDSNLARLREFCTAHRFLLLLTGTATEGPAWDLLFGGRCSTLLVEAPSPAPAADELAAAQAALACGPSATEAEWLELCRWARLGRRLTRDAGRFAECYEMMQQWYTAAHSRADLHALDEAAREMVWILEAWGDHAEAARLDYRRASESGEQMLLPFA
ncbi:MAG TPA: toll/interleukin-1 receptor domain-containing protein [Bryobacteraceae bacterium]|nr:toll/interleukin-1 receptor domain-containing protein [Bryobacteraceae bacterium]